MWGIMFTQGAALGYVIVRLSARLRPHYQFYRTAIDLNTILITPWFCVFSNNDELFESVVYQL